MPPRVFATRRRLMPRHAAGLEALCRDAVRWAGIGQIMHDQPLSSFGPTTPRHKGGQAARAPCLVLRDAGLAAARRRALSALHSTLARSYGRDCPEVVVSRAGRACHGCHVELPSKLINSGYYRCPRLFVGKDGPRRQRARDIAGPQCRPLAWDKFVRRRSLVSSAGLPLFPLQERDCLRRYGGYMGTA